MTYIHTWLDSKICWDIESVTHHDLTKVRQPSPPIQFSEEWSLTDFDACICCFSSCLTKLSVDSPCLTYKEISIPSMMMWYNLTKVTVTVAIVNSMKNKKKESQVASES